MNRRMLGRIVLTLVVVGGLVAVGTGLYQAGYQDALVAGADGETLRRGLYPGYWAFGFFGLLFRVFILVLLVGLVTRLFFWRRPGGRWSGEGHPGWADMRRRAEDHFTEWHRQAHEGSEPPAPAT